MKKYFFTLKDDELHIAHIKKRGKKTKILDSTVIHDPSISKYVSSYGSGRMDVLDEPMTEFFQQIKRKPKSADFILGMDSIISRTIEIPCMSNKDLTTYVENNISDLFSVDMEDYYYDYKIIKIIKNKEEKTKTIQLKVVVLQKSIVKGIEKLTEKYELKLGSILIYPDIYERLVKDDEAFGILDIGLSKCILNIYDKGATFIYTTIDYSGMERDDFIDEIEYFTDFFASRHGGENLGRLYVTWTSGEYDGLIEHIDDRLNTHVTPIDVQAFKRRASKEDMFRYPALVLSQLKVKEIRNMAIDFGDDEILRLAKDKSFKPIYLFLLLLIVTGGWYILADDYLETQMQLYEGDYSHSTLYMDLESELKTLTDERDELLAYKEAYELIERERYDMKSYVEIIFEAVPDGMTIEKMTVDKSVIDINFSNVSSTLDMIETIIAINNTDEFEILDIKDIALNDDIGDYTISLSKKTDEKALGEVVQ